MSSVYNGVIYQPITVDVSQPNEFAPLLVKQRDAYSRGYDITLTDSGKALNISTQNSTVWFNCCNQSDTTKKASVAGNINENGTVTVIVPAVVMDVKGLIRCDISVITAVGEETHILKSTLFYLNCEAAANPDNATSETEESILAGIAAGTICPPGGPYVSKSRKIAGIDLQDDITAEELIAALDIHGGVTVIDDETSAEWDGEIPDDYEGEKGAIALYDGDLWYLVNVVEYAQSPDMKFYYWNRLMTADELESVKANIDRKMSYAPVNPTSAQIAALPTGQQYVDTQKHTINIKTGSGTSSAAYDTEYIDGIIGDVEALLAQV